MAPPQPEGKLRDSGSRDKPLLFDNVFTDGEIDSWTRLSGWILRPLTLSRVRETGNHRHSRFGADLKGRASNGFVALHWVANMLFEVLELLLEHGAHDDAKSRTTNSTHAGSHWELVRTL